MVEKLNYIDLYSRQLAIYYLRLLVSFSRAKYFLIYFVSKIYNYYEGRIISKQNLNEYLETLHLTPTQFCNLPGFYGTTGFLRSHLFSLISLSN